MPSDDAEKTTPRQVKRLRCRLNRAVDCTVENFIPSAAVGHSIERLNIYHSSLRENFGAVLLCQVKIVLVERVLGAVTTTHHAAAARRAGRSLRPFSAEIRVRKGLPTGLSLGRLKDGNMRPVEGVSDACGVGNLLQQKVGRAKDFVLRDAQHSRGRRVMLRHLRLPLRQAFPRSVVPNFVGRSKQSAGIRNRSATHGTAVQNGDMPEEAHVEEAPQAQDWDARTSDEWTNSYAAGSQASSGGPSP